MEIELSIVKGQVEPGDELAAAAALEISRPLDLADLSIPYTMGSAYLASNQGQQVITEFQIIIDHPSVEAAQPEHSLARLGLAQPLVTAGDGQSTHGLSEFSDALEGCRSRHPILKQAKAEYAKLK
jgi:hypothetical protein